MLIEIIALVIFLVAMCVIIKFNYKKCETGEAKGLLIMYAIICVIPIVIYYLDLWNIPSKLHLTENVNSQNWLAFLANYTSSIVSAVIGMTVSIYLVFIQIKKNNEDTEKRDKENLRLQNIPILKYSINTEENVEDEDNGFIMTNVDDGKPYKLNIYLKNIGLNNIKNIKVDFQADFTNNSIKRLLGKHSIEVMEKGEEKVIRKYFSLKNSDIPYEIIITVYYEDVLSNWYKQELHIKYSATDSFKPGGYIGKVTYEIKEEGIVENNKIII